MSKDNKEFDKGEKCGPLTTEEELNKALKNMNENLQMIVVSMERQNRTMTELIGVLKRR